MPNGPPPNYYVRKPRFIFFVLTFDITGKVSQDAAPGSEVRAVVRQLVWYTTTPCAFSTDVRFRCTDFSHTESSGSGFCDIFVMMLDLWDATETKSGYWGNSQQAPATPSRTSPIPRPSHPHHPWDIKKKGDTQNRWKHKHRRWKSDEKTRCPSVSRAAVALFVHAVRALRSFRRHLSRSRQIPRRPSISRDLTGVGLLEASQCAPVRHGNTSILLRAILTVQCSYDAKLGGHHFWSTAAGFFFFLSSLCRSSSQQLSPLHTFPPSIPLTHTNCHLLYR